MNHLCPHGSLDCAECHYHGPGLLGRPLRMGPPVVEIRRMPQRSGLHSVSVRPEVHGLLQAAAKARGASMAVLLEQILEPTLRGGES